MRSKFLILLFCGIFCAPWCVSLRAQYNTDRIMSIGRNALYFNDYVLSIQYFNRVIKLKPYLWEPYLLRAIAKIELGDYTGAVSDCGAALELNPFASGAYYVRGYAHRSMERYALAQSDFDAALALSPENRTYMMLRADVLAAQQKYDSALLDIDFLIKREPRTASLHFERGVICMQKADTVCAEESFVRTTELDSQNPSNWSALGMVRLVRGEESLALEALTKAINLGSKWAGDYINRGIIFYRQHKYRNALSDYDAAVSLAPSDAQCYLNRGVLRHELGDYNNALSDFNEALRLRADYAEIYYHRGVTLLQLRQWEKAVADFDALIARYPYFLPAYFLAAQAKSAMGDSKGAYRYRHTANEIESKKDSIQAAQLNTSMQVAQAQQSTRDRRKEFSAEAAQNQEQNAYASGTRGTVQHNYVNVVNEPNIVLTYYSKNSDLRTTNYSHYIVEEYNKKDVLPSPLRFSAQELSLTAEMVNKHFAQIDNLTNAIDKAQQNANLYFARAIEFALVQDYSSAIDDCTQAITLAPDMLIAYFCRANWRFKLLDFQRANGELKQDNNLAFEIMFRDYDYVTKMQSDFSFAYYNKANMLCILKDYKAAIQNYNLAIKADDDFAEAYYNRGLTHIYIGQTEKGIKDLSKAGELGIYQAYNLITRFQR